MDHNMHDQQTHAIPYYTTTMAYYIFAVFPNDKLLIELSRTWSTASKDQLGPGR